MPALRRAANLMMSFPVPVLAVRTAISSNITPGTGFLRLPPAIPAELKIIDRNMINALSKLSLN